MDQLLEDLQGRVHIFPGNIASFLSIMVPSCAPDVPRPVSKRAFSKYRPPKGKKVKGYAALLFGLRGAVSSFPDNKKPKFFPLRRQELSPPFPESSRGRCTTTPDLAVSFPGDTSTAFDWENTAMFIQVMGNRTDDPFEESHLSEEHGATVAVVQLVIGARALMAIHGHYAVFALGIYATTCRIIRSDPACVVASPPFSLKRHPEYLQQFFWKLSHPHGVVAVGGSIIGCDPTVRKLTLAEQDSLQVAGLPVPSNLALCRHVECEGTCGSTVILKAYFTVGFIDVSPRLLSQATVVLWRAVEDPRRPPDAHLSAFSKVEGNIAVVVVKDCWRQLSHQSDLHFFDKIEGSVPNSERERIGLPAYVVGRDLGDVTVHYWTAVSPCALPATIDAIREQLEGEPDSESALPVPGPATMPAGSPPLPLQQTCTSHLVQGPEGVENERSHMRCVTSTVGRPLTEFKDTRQLCQAVRNAVAAHKALWENHRILHRDISPRNILIRADADECQSDFVGFLHDFHHSSMVAGDVGRFASFERDRDEDYDTRYFMAAALLESPKGRHEVDHDLESFFWVLLWVFLRHTKHRYPQDCEECTTLFGTGPNRDVDRDVGDYGALKRGYLFSFFDIVVRNHAPLSGLLRGFKFLCSRSMGGPFACRPRRMTHDQVLAIFDSALRADGWPTDGDGPRPFVAPGDLGKAGGATAESTNHPNLKRRRQGRLAKSIVAGSQADSTAPRLQKRARVLR